MAGRPLEAVRRDEIGGFDSYIQNSSVRTSIFEYLLASGTNATIASDAFATKRNLLGAVGLEILFDCTGGTMLGGDTLTINFYRKENQTFFITDTVAVTVPAVSNGYTGRIVVPSDLIKVSQCFAVSGTVATGSGATVRIYACLLDQAAQDINIAADAADEASSPSAGYDPVDDTFQVEVTNIDGSTSDVLPFIPIVNETNAAAGTVYWPAAGGIPMKVGNKSLTLWDSSVGGVTLTIQIAPTSAFTTPVAIAGVNMTDATTFAADWVDSNGKAISYENIGMCYYRLKVVTSDTSNTVLAYINQW